MPTKDHADLELGLIDEDGMFNPINRPPIKIDTGRIDVSGLQDTPMVYYNRDRGLEFEIIDRRNNLKIPENMGKGSRVICETSCVCDGTMFFAVCLAEFLKSYGCVCVSVRSETVEDANPEWMNCRFIASGIMWNTNNWRRMHRVPMKRRKTLNVLSGRHDY